VNLDAWADIAADDLGDWRGTVPGAWLFPDLKVNRLGVRTQKWSEWFGVTCGVQWGYRTGE
jgi:hypothetical protein